MMRIYALDKRSGPSLEHWVLRSEIVLASLKVDSKLPIRGSPVSHTPHQTLLKCLSLFWCFSTMIKSCRVEIFFQKRILSTVILIYTCRRCNQDFLPASVYFIRISSMKAFLWVFKILLVSITLFMQVFVCLTEKRQSAAETSRWNCEPFCSSTTDKLHCEIFRKDLSS